MSITFIQYSTDTQVFGSYKERWVEATTHAHEIVVSLYNSKRVEEIRSCDRSIVKSEEALHDPFLSYNYERTAKFSEDN